MKNIIKKISAIAMCGVLTVGSVLMTGAVSEELGGVIVSFTGILGPIMKHPFLTASGTFPDDHRTGRGLGKAQHARYYV